MRSQAFFPLSFLKKKFHIDLKINEGAFTVTFCLTVLTSLKKKRISTPLSAKLQAWKAFSGFFFFLLLFAYLSLTHCLKPNSVVQYVLLQVQWD